MYVSCLRNLALLSIEKYTLHKKFFASLFSLRKMYYSMFFFGKHLYCNHFVAFSVVDKELKFFTSYKNCFVLKNFKVRPSFKAEQASSLFYETTNNRFILIFKCIRLST